MAKKCIHGFADHPEWCSRCTKPPANVVPPVDVDVATGTADDGIPEHVIEAAARALDSSTAEMAVPKPYTLASGYVVKPTPPKTKKLTRAEIYGKWNEIAAELLALKEGESTEVDVFPGVPVERFRDNTRANLCTRADTKGIMWHVRLLHNLRINQAIRIERGAEKTSSPTTRTEVHEHIEETKTTHRVTVEESVPATAEVEQIRDGGNGGTSPASGERDGESDLRPREQCDQQPIVAVVDGGKPQTVNAGKCGSTNTPVPETLPAVIPESVPVPVVRDLGKRFLRDRDERATCRDLISQAIKLFDPFADVLDVGDMEWQEMFEKFESMAERARAEQEASALADQYMSLIEDGADEKLSDKAYGATWELMHCLLSEKRLLEYEAFRYVKHLREHGDPVQADVVAELLPEADREKLNANKHKKTPDSA